MAESESERGKIIDEKFGGSACLYIQAIKDEGIWKQQLANLPLGSSDMQKFEENIHEIAIECGGNSEAFENAMAKLFTEEIEPLTMPFVTGDDLWVLDVHSAIYNMSISQAREYKTKLQESLDENNKK